MILRILLWVGSIAGFIVFVVGLTELPSASTRTIEPTETAKSNALSEFANTRGFYMVVCGICSSIGLIMIVMFIQDCQPTRVVPVATSVATPVAVPVPDAVSINVEPPRVTFAPSTNFNGASIEVFRMPNQPSAP
jgi:hypothetical protein